MPSVEASPKPAAGLSRENPFPGLRPYEEEDAPWFFGRGRETNELLKRLRRVRFLAVVGPSGSGKSSLVKAGLLPAIRDGYLDAPWRIATFRPGDQPLENLASAISTGGMGGTASVREHLESGPLGLVSAIQESQPDPDTHVLILVDQFEELFQFVQRKGRTAQEETKSFLKLLLTAAACDTAPIFVVITMRLEWLNEAATYVGLAEAINEALYLVPQMSRRQFQQAILGPIEAADGSLTTALLDRMLNDLDGRSDQLPILQHALMRMWERRAPDAALDTATYVAVGELSKCLELHAEEIYKEFDETGRCAAEALFRSITQVFKDRKVRRPRPLGEIIDCTRLPLEQFVPVVQAFHRMGRSFLVITPGTLGRHSVIDISHEALMRQWTRLEKWVESEAELQSKIDRLEGSAAEWNAGHRQNRSLLYRGAVLAEAEKWSSRLSPSGPAIPFLSASRQSEFWRKVLLRTTIGIAFALLITVTGRWSLLKWRAKGLEAEEARLHAKWLDQQRTYEVQYNDYLRSKVDEQVKADCSSETAERIHNSLAKIAAKRVYVQYPGASQHALAKAVQAALEGYNYAVPGLEAVGAKSPAQTEVRFWHAEDEDRAGMIVNILRPLMTGPVVAKRIPENVKNVVPTGQFEIWLAAEAEAPGRAAALQ